MPVLAQRRSVVAGVAPAAPSARFPRPGHGGQSATQLSAASSVLPRRLDFEQRTGVPWFWRFTPWKLGAVNLRNPAQIQQAGTLPMSLHEVLQLALANNLAIASAGFERLFAQTDLLRSQAGEAARGIAGANIASTLFSGAIGAGVSGRGGIGGSGAGSVVGGSSGVRNPGSGPYDPVVSVIGADEHARIPLNSSLLFGTAEQAENDGYGGMSLAQGFSTGTSYNVSVFGARSYINSTALLFNPGVTTNFSVAISQELLNGSSRMTNRRFILVAKNETRIADVVFRQKVIDVVAATAEQYWQLAQDQEQVKIARQALDDARRMYSDTQELVKAGRAPEINLVQAQMEVSRRRRQRIDAETELRKQSLQLKLSLAKDFTPALMAATIVPSDALPEPQAHPELPVEPLIRRAVASSPALEQGQLNLETDAIAAKATRNAMLPSLSVYASYTASGLSGRQQVCAVAQSPCPPVSMLPPIAGGLPQSLGQTFRGRFPDYGVGFSLSFPVFNRSARADQARAEFELAQARVNLRNQRNQLSQQVASSVIELQGKAEDLHAAQETEQFARQSLQGQQEKYRMGRATLVDVVTAENALLDAEQQAAQARADYARSQVELAKISGTLLDDLRVQLQPQAR